MRAGLATMDTALPVFTCRLFHPQPPCKAANSSSVSHVRLLSITDSRNASKADLPIVEASQQPAAVITKSPGFIDLNGHSSSHLDRHIVALCATSCHDQLSCMDVTSGWLHLIAHCNQQSGGMSCCSPHRSSDSSMGRGITAEYGRAFLHSVSGLRICRSIVSASFSRCAAISVPLPEHAAAAPDYL